jgi:hypothetical protein
LSGDVHLKNHAQDDGEPGDWNFSSALIGGSGDTTHGDSW